MTHEVDVYVFSSDSITNIWAGYGARTWAVSSGANPRRKAKLAEGLDLGSLGLLYCVPWRSFTVPFVTTTKPDKERIEPEIWQGDWILPFRFQPLSTPRKRVVGTDLYDLLPGLKSKGINNFSHYLSVQSNFDFQPSRIAAQDWAKLIDILVPND